MNLPNKRKDDLCCDCMKNLAVTNDGRWCKKCIKTRIKEKFPIIYKYQPYRDRGAQQSMNTEDNPSFENGVRILEGG